MAENKSWKVAWTLKLLLPVNFPKATLDTRFTNFHPLKFPVFFQDISICKEVVATFSCYYGVNVKMVLRSFFLFLRSNFTELLLLIIIIIIIIIIAHIFKFFNQEHFFKLILSAPTSQNGQTYSNNSSATVDKLFECVLWFCEIDAFRFKGFLKMKNIYKTFKEFWKTSVTP